MPFPNQTTTGCHSEGKRYVAGCRAKEIWLPRHGYCAARYDTTEGEGWLVCDAPLGKVTWRGVPVLTGRQHDTVRVVIALIRGDYAEVTGRPPTARTAVVMAALREHDFWLNRWVLVHGWDQRKAQMLVKYPECFEVISTLPKVDKKPVPLTDSQETSARLMRARGYSDERIAQLLAVDILAVRSTLTNRRRSIFKSLAS